LGVLFASVGASEVKAAALYEIVVSINDLTTPGDSTSFTVLSTSSTANTAPPGSQMITASGTFLGTQTAGTGITFSSLGSSFSNGSSSSQLNIGGLLAVTSTDSYVITISTINEGYTSPLGTTSTLSESESSTDTYTASAASQSQAFQSWYTFPAPATFPPPSGPTTGSQSIPIPPGALSPTSGSTSTLSSSPFATGLGNSPFSLSNVVTITVSGTSSANNPTIQFQGSTTITAASVPEPASLVMMLTGMPMPLVVLGMLRRRKAQRRTDVIS